MSLTPDYIQDNDPGAMGAFKVWYAPTTKILKVRKPDDSGWFIWGSMDQDYLGNMPKSGASATGTFGGNTGLSPKDSNDFQTLKRLGVDVVDQTQLTEAVDTLRTDMASMIREAQASAIAAQSIRGQFAIDNGDATLTSLNSWTFTIPLPYYTDADGNEIEQAQKADTLFFWAIKKPVWDTDYDGAGWISIDYTVVDENIVTAKSRTAHGDGSGVNDDRDLTISWMSIAIKKG